MVILSETRNLILRREISHFVRNDNNVILSKAKNLLLQGEISHCVRNDNKEWRFLTSFEMTEIVIPAKAGIQSFLRRQVIEL